MEALSDFQEHLARIFSKGLNELLTGAIANRVGLPKPKIFAQRSSSTSGSYDLALLYGGASHGPNQVSQ